MKLKVPELKSTVIEWGKKSLYELKWRWQRLVELENRLIISLTDSFPFLTLDLCLETTS